MDGIGMVNDGSKSFSHVNFREAETWINWDLLALRIESPVSKRNQSGKPLMFDEMNGDVFCCPCSITKVLVKIC